jgi:hypothetical protein
MNMRGNQVRLLLLAIVVVLAAIRYPAIRWFVGISILFGVVLLPVVRWWNNRPAKVQGDDQIRLNLDDDSNPINRDLRNSG